MMMATVCSEWPNCLVLFSFFLVGVCVHASTPPGASARVMRQLHRRHLRALSSLHAPCKLLCPSRTVGGARIVCCRSRCFLRGIFCHRCIGHAMRWQQCLRRDLSCCGIHLLPGFFPDRHSGFFPEISSGRRVPPIIFCSFYHVNTNLQPRGPDECR